MQYQLQVEIGAYAGDLDYALDYLERAREAGLIDRNWLEYCPVLEDLRGEALFEKTVETVEERVAAIHSEQSELSTTA